MCSIKDCNKPSINKKYDLCNDHNFERLNGRSRQAVYAERLASRPKKIYKLQSTKKPRQQSKKDSQVKKELSAVKKEIELDAISEDRYFCWGCGKSSTSLDKSHILSVGRFKHLELDKRNINLFDRDCHNVWEHGAIEEKVRLLTFKKDFLYICEKNKQEAQKLLTKMWEYYDMHPDTEAGKIISSIVSIIGRSINSGN